MTVVHLIGGLAGGGAEQMVLNLCRAAQSHPDCRMLVVSLSDRVPMLPRFRRAGIPVKILHLNSVWDFPRARRAYRHWLAGLERPLVVHAHLYHAAIFAVFSGGIRPLFSLHNSRLPGPFRRTMLWLTRPWRRLDLGMPGYPAPAFLRKPLRFLPNGVFEESWLRDPDLRRPAAPFASGNELRLLFVGRLDDQKNPLLLADLARTLREKIPLRLDILGEGPLAARLANRIRQWELESEVLLRGFREDVAEAMRHAHALVLCSRFEGIPLTLLEAGMAGLPIIATETACPPLLHNGNAYTGPPERLAACVEDLANDYAKALDKARRLQEQLRREFVMERVWDQYLTLYRENGV